MRKRRPDRRVAAWFRGVHTTELFVSVLSLGELRQGIERLRRRDPAQASILAQWLETLERDFVDRALPVSGPVADAWGRLTAVRPLPDVDALLGATALVHGLTLVTRDTALVGTGVPLLDPWQP